jgi:CelD/BcsL family acetyltransferase involved in cellulose biosynthesis
VSAGGATIGLLYNFVHQGNVAFYQSGLRYEGDNRLKPGNVTHALVIQACLEQGLDSYDFLTGAPSGSRYKQSLATDTSPLAWTVLRRPTVQTQILSALRALRRVVKRPRQSPG